jgi:crotonobetainyl-CoA:carnitine CoA-transferase CaiB-like acyl-CoA transferase
MPTPLSTPFRPLDGIKVIDLSHVIAGPFATFQLARMGADVCKIETVKGGDVMRRSAKGLKPFVALNAGKRKLAVDLTSAAGLELVGEFVRTADVLVDNLRPGTLEKLGLGFEAACALNPRIVYCSISGFGRAADRSGTGSGFAGRPAYDHVVQAASGMTLSTGMAGDPPSKIGFPLIDATAGMLACMAILAGLRERDRTGRGLLLDVSMAGAALQLMYPLVCDALTDGTTPVRAGNQAHSGSPAGDVFQACDGAWIALAANTPAQFIRLLDVLGIPEVGRDPALFASPLDPKAPAAFLQAKDPAGIKAALRLRIATLDATDLERRCAAVDVPAARVRTLPEFLAEAEASGAIEPVELEDEGTRVRSTGLGFKVTPA